MATRRQDLVFPASATAISLTVFAGFADVVGWMD